MPGINTSGRDHLGNSFNNQTKEIDHYPNECPVCGRTIVAELLNQPFVAIDVLEVFARCPHVKCSRAFIALYRFNKELSAGRPVQIFNFERSLPVEAKTDKIPPEISALSPSFARIHAQAALAEQHGLDEIAGPGYRKALEFLIKDYAISLVNEEAAKNDIKAIQLGNVIAKYLTGDKLPVVSKRAAWLGNDETHYQRRWVGKDLDDLKTLIQAVEHVIAMELLVKNLPVDMPDPKTAAKPALPGVAPAP